MFARVGTHHLLIQQPFVTLQLDAARGMVFEDFKLNFIIEIKIDFYSPFKPNDLVKVYYETLSIYFSTNTDLQKFKKIECSLI